MIEIRTKKVTIPDSLKGMDKTVKKSITEALFSELDVVGAVHGVRTNYLYTKVKKRSGKLGESMTPEKRRINQYTSMFGFYFDPRIAPYASTHISDSTTGTFKTIKPSTKSYLAIPAPSGPAFRVRSRIAPKDLGGSSDSSSAFMARRKVLYSRHAGVRGVPYFILREEVKVPQKMSERELLSEFERELTPQMNRIAFKVVSRLGQ